MLLVKAGADVHVADEGGTVALHYAARAQLTGLCDVLIEAGAEMPDIDSDEEGRDVGGGRSNQAAPGGLQPAVLAELAAQLLGSTMTGAR